MGATGSSKTWLSRWTFRTPRSFAHTRRERIYNQQRIKSPSQSVAQGSFGIFLLLDWATGPSGWVNGSAGSSSAGSTAGGMATGCSVADAGSAASGGTTPSGAMAAPGACLRTSACACRRARAGAPAATHFPSQQWRQFLSGEMLINE